LARGIGDVTLLRGLKASGLASLFLRSFSSLVMDRGSLLMRKLSITESRVGLFQGKKRSGDLREPKRFELEPDSDVFKELRRNLEAMDRALSRGRVAADRAGFDSSGPSYRPFILSAESRSRKSPSQTSQSQNCQHGGSPPFEYQSLTSFMMCIMMFVITFVPLPQTELGSWGCICTTIVCPVIWYIGLAGAERRRCGFITLICMQDAVILSDESANEVPNEERHC
jgi:hypothetical protein